MIMTKMAGMGASCVAAMAAAVADRGPKAARAPVYARCDIPALVSVVSHTPARCRAHHYLPPGENTVITGA